MNKVIIIAEAGVNHNGNLKTAFELIEAASNAGADYVKFQTFKADKLVSRYSEKANYQKLTTSSDETQYDMIKKLELSHEDHLALIDYCQKIGIGFLSSPFDVDGINYLDSLNVDYFKIPSGEITNLPYLRELTKFNRPIILSTGMSYLEEVREALKVLKNQKVIVLHCNTEYPTPFADVNLRAMISMKDELNIEVGYSDHTLGIEVPIAAVAMGAKVIEKHFTIDTSLDGPDHKASLNPKELKDMVKSIRNIEQSLGSSQKKPSSSELKNIPFARKSIVASKAIKSGDLFSLENITVKRPAGGISPMMWDKVLGEKAKRDFSKDEQIE